MAQFVGIRVLQFSGILPLTKKNFTHSVRSQNYVQQRADLNRDKTFGIRYRVGGDQLGGKG